MPRVLYTTLFQDSIKNYRVLLLAINYPRGQKEWSQRSQWRWQCWLCSTRRKQSHQQSTKCFDYEFSTSGKLIIWWLSCNYSWIEIQRIVNIMFWFQNPGLLSTGKRFESLHMMARFGKILVKVYDSTTRIQN